MNSTGSSQRIADTKVQLNRLGACDVIEDTGHGVKV
jgi:hypothetical protein